MTRRKLAVVSGVIALLVLATVSTPRLLSRVIGRQRLRRTDGMRNQDGTRKSERRVPDSSRAGAGAETRVVGFPAQAADELRADRSKERSRPIRDFADYPPPDLTGDRVDEASWQSFPASDAPPWR